MIQLEFIQKRGLIRNYASSATTYRLQASMHNLNPEQLYDFRKFKINLYVAMLILIQNPAELHFQNLNQLYTFGWYEYFVLTGLL